MCLKGTFTSVRSAFEVRAISFEVEGDEDRGDTEDGVVVMAEVDRLPQVQQQRQLPGSLGSRTLRGRPGRSS
jgi:hypothetical protein